MDPTEQIFISFIFLAVNVSVLLLVLVLNRRTDREEQPQTPGESANSEVEINSGPHSLPAVDILGWEYEYARATASEAMQDRHRMINFYLLAVGVILSAVIGLLGSATVLPAGTETVLLWILCGIGWFYFLKIVRLRQAWHGSAVEMSHIKDFYVAHVADFDRKTLQGAFLWKSETIPRPDKPWSVFFLSAMLVAYLNSTVYVMGSVLLSTNNVRGTPFLVIGILILLGILFLFFHIRMWFALFK